MATRVKSCGDLGEVERVNDGCADGRPGEGAPCTKKR